MITEGLLHAASLSDKITYGREKGRLFQDCVADLRIRDYHVAEAE